MVPGYNTLEEAAQILAMDVDELRQMAQKNQIRSFQDRGTLRFRAQDIQELARQRGVASDPDQPILAPPHTPTKPRKSRFGFPEPVVETGGADIFDFSIEVNDDAVDIGREMLPGGPKSSASKKPPASSKSKPGSDSDVRLITDQELAPQAGSDSDIKLVSQESGVKGGSSSQRKKSSLPPGSAPVSPTKPKSALFGPPSSGPRSPGRKESHLGGSKLVGHSPPPKKSSSNVPLDQDAHFLLTDSDSDVKIVGAGSDEMSLGKTHIGPTDSDIRLEGQLPPPAKSDEAMLLTEEINLDEEIRKQEEALRQEKPQAKVRPKSKIPRQSSLAPPPAPSESAVSPFELSEDEPRSAQTPRTPKKPAVNPDVDSSDFDLVPASENESSPVQFQGDAGDDFSLELPEENIGLGGSQAHELSGPTSGINLSDPVDAGISLELEPEATPRPAQMHDSGLGDSSSEFEINLDDSSEEHASVTPGKSAESDFEVGAADLSSSENQALSPESSDSDSEFELTLDSSDEVPAMEQSPADSDSDSEFELTLDDSGNLAAEGAGEAAAEGDKDIFETDFEVPGLDEESSSQVGALDTDLESSDFDIQVEDESGSAVVALDDSDASEDEKEEEPPPPPVKKTKLGKDKSKPAKQVKVKKKSDDDEEAEAPAEDEEPAEDDLFGDLDDSQAAMEILEEEIEPAGAAITPRGAVALKPAPWGVLPTVFMLPCLVIMIVLGLLSFELVQSSSGYKPPGMLTTILTKNVLGK